MTARTLPESLHETSCPAPTPEPHARRTPLSPLSLVKQTAHWVKIILCGMDKARTLGLAAEMSFWLFLSLIPLAAVAGLIAARLAFAHYDAIGPVLESAPPEVSSMLAQQMGKVAAWNGGTVAPVATLVFVWLAASGIHSVFDALEVQTGSTRPWWKKRLIAIGTCLVLSLGLAALALLGTGVGWIEKLVGPEAHVVTRALGSNAALSAFGSVARVFVGAGLAFALIAGLYWVGLPPSVRGRMPIVPGAFLAVALQLVMGLGYGLYLSKMGTGDAYQAGLAVMGITLMTLYLFSLAVLIGAELNQVLGERRIQRAARKRDALRDAQRDAQRDTELAPETHDHRAMA